MKILLADSLAPLLSSALEEAGDTLLIDSSLKGDSLLEAMKSFQPEVLVVRSTKVERQHIEENPSLSLIIRAGAGVNTIDLDAASQRGVFVANCPGRNAIAVAELVMGHIINIDRRISDNIRDFDSGVWNKKGYSKATGLYGQTLAILGFGSIGKELAARAQAFGIHCKAWSRSLNKEEAQQYNVTHCSSLEEAIDNSDIISVHLPSNAHTKHIINANIFSQMKSGATFINSSRGDLVDETALLTAIQEKDIKIGLDVFHNEPGSGDSSVSSPLQSNDNIYVTHHIGASTNQATESVGEAVLDIITTWKQDGLVLNCVNIAKQTAANSCLSVRHADKVGVLASILEAVRADGLNIQEMDNIIFQGGKAACARIFLVGTPSSELLNSLQENGDVFACSVS